MVQKKGCLSEEELIELLALNGIIPGPASTQTIVSIGYKVGGRLLALFTLLVWATISETRSIKLFESFYR